MRWRRIALLCAGTFGFLLDGARADVIPPCGGIAFDLAPAPVEAGHAAIRLLPNALSEGVFTTRLLRTDGSSINLTVERDVPGERMGSATYLLRPVEPIEPGVHRLEYSDVCADGPTLTDVEFETAPPPPEDFAEFTVSYEAYCSGTVLDSGLEGDYPPPVLLTLPFDAALKPYVPFVRLRLTDRQSGTEKVLRHTFQKVDSPFWFRLSTNCGVIPFDLETPHPELTLTGELIDGPELFRKTASPEVPCPDCPPDYPPDGGSDDSDNTPANGPSAAKRGGCEAAPFTVVPSRVAFVSALVFGAWALSRRRAGLKRAGAAGRA